MRLEAGETHLATERMSVTKTKIVRLRSPRNPSDSTAIAGANVRPDQRALLEERARWSPGSVRAGYEALPW